jgi:hypothetical protein
LLCLHIVADKHTELASIAKSPSGMLASSAADLLSCLPSQACAGMETMSAKELKQTVTNATRTTVSSPGSRLQNVRYLAAACTVF